tara:strand:+ start:1317 stop:1427 length:111 start_codon:yes stop_codon:yes gene_type:complete
MQPISEKLYKKIVESYKQGYIDSVIVESYKKRRQTL